MEKAVDLNRKKMRNDNWMKFPISSDAMWRVVVEKKILCYFTVK
jgi:hypothetical protein